MTKYRFGLTAICVALILAAFITLRIATSQNTLDLRQKITSTKQEDVTPIQLGVMTEKQKKHSKLFKGNHYKSGPKVADLVAKKGDVKLWGPIREVPRSQLPLNDSLVNLKCNTDAIIIGTPTSKTSNLIETGTFLFTDYEITVEEVLRSNDLTPVQSGQSITIPRLGGSVLLNGHLVEAVDDATAPLEKGERYLFYLKYDALAGTFKPLGHPMFDDTFRLSEDKVSQVSRKPLPLRWKQETDKAAFLSKVRNTLAHPCQLGGER